MSDIEKKKKHFLHLRVSERQRGMIDELVEQVGAMHDAEVVRIAIMDMHSRYFGNGVSTHHSAGKMPGRGRPRKENKEQEAQREIIEALGGELVDNNGAKIVKYMIWEVVNPNLVEGYEQELPLSHLHRDLIERQFRPSKEEVEKVKKAMAEKE